MGSVYRCRHLMVDGIQAAVKILKAGGGFGDRERFLREIKAVYNLRHPAIVRVTGFGEDAQREHIWMAMELVEGQTLEKHIAAGPTPIPDALRLFQPLADGLAHAHEKGIFHRDLKPANIVVDAHGQAVLVDFGIAGMEGGTRLTATGVVAGTPGYMAPEVFGGEDVTPQATDVYALGQVFCEVLVGTRAFPEPDGMSDGQRLMHLIGSKTKRDDLDPGEGFPEALRQFVREATAQEPAERLPDMATFAARLRAIQHAAPAQATAPAPTQAPKQPAPPARKPDPPAAKPKKKASRSTTAKKRSLFLLIGAGSGIILMLTALIVIIFSLLLLRSGQSSRTPSETSPVAQPEAAVAPESPPKEEAPAIEAQETEPSQPAPASKKPARTKTPAKKTSSTAPAPAPVPEDTSATGTSVVPAPETTPAPTPAVAVPAPEKESEPPPAKPLSDLEKEVLKRKQRLLRLAAGEWKKIESRMSNTEPKYLVGSVKAFISRHEKLLIRIGDYEERVQVPEIKTAKAWLAANGGL